MNDFETAGFLPADLLLPNGADLYKWCTVACDQYTSEPDYWNETERIVGGAPSTLRMIFPEIYLNDPGFDERIAAIHRTMEQTLRDGRLTDYPQALILTRRTQSDGRVRTGLIGAIDLELYDYRPGAKLPIRATEGTVLERIPPRVRIRKGAPLELPHILLLMDDDARTVIEPLARKADSYRKLYDTPLMQNGGRVEGFLVPTEDFPALGRALAALADPARFAARYHQPAEEMLAFAVGDGNHSLAAAKACYEALKEEIGDAAKATPARYALVELMNLYDPALEFEAIHRVVSGTDPERLLNALRDELGAVEGSDGQHFTVLCGGKRLTLSVPYPSAALTVGTVQRFLDSYLAENAGTLDYIHGADVVERLCEAPGAVGFLLPTPRKNDLFPTVIADGALPRKTFSMGNAWDKRYYLEARKIK